MSISHYPTSSRCTKSTKILIHNDASSPKAIIKRMVIVHRTILTLIHEYQYCERAYRVFKHYLVHKLKSQHDSTIHIIPFILGYIQSTCIIFIYISIFSNNININICTPI
eukprot:770048_1